MATTGNLQLSTPYSSTSYSSPPTWDVFLSFYGNDTRRNFTSHLYSALVQAGILTFMDDPELEKGGEISRGLLNAIHGSKIYIVVLSENYASSRWCLDELVEILTCKRTNGHVAIIPVFYYVDLSELRHHKGSFGHALNLHEKRYSVDIIEKWKSALAEIAELSGYHLKTDANESDTIQEIVKNVTPLICTKDLHLEEYLVGIDSSVEEVYKKLSMETNDVRAIGICGMGGIGKTTTAKAFYNKYFTNFDTSCFVDDVKQHSQGGSYLVPLLQRLSDKLLGMTDYKDVKNGIRRLKQFLSTKKALIVVDDLDQSSYSEVLVRLCNMVSSGSRIIFTTRDANLVNQLKNDTSQVDIYMMGGLKQVDSLELFSYHAFRKPTPPVSFRELSVSFITYAGGLPLALKVLGSSLLGRTDVSFWKDKLEKVKEIGENDIQKILRMSYDELGNETQKAIFLDIAFFFVGRDKYEAVHIFKSCDFFPNEGIPVLVERCLLTISKDNKFQMHNLIQDMGNKVINEESEHGNCRHLYLGQENASKGLQKLEPSVNLKTIDLSYSRNLKTTPDFTDLTLVDKLVLRECTRLLELHPSIGQLTDLSHLDLSGCENLKRLPEAIKLTALVSLNLGGCRKLTRLPEQLGDMKCLKMLDASKTAIKYLPDTFVDLVNLVKLELRFCSKLQQLPEQLGKMQCLEKLDASFTAIEELPDSIEQLTRLKVLNLEFCNKLRNLPSSIWNLTSLTQLSLLHQEGMKILALRSRFPLDLYFSTGGLGLGYESHIFYGLSTIPNLIHLTLRNWTSSLPELPLNLKTLSILKYASLEPLPDLSSLKQLHGVSIEGSISLQSLPPLPPHLEALDVKECPNLQDVPDLSNLKELENLSFSKCSILTSLPPLPPRLYYLKVEECPSLQDVPDLSNLKELEYVNFRKCNNMKSLPPFPPHLKSLDVEECPSLQDVTDLSNLKELVYVSFRKCNNLKSISFSQSCLQVCLLQTYFKATIPNREVAEWFSHKSSGDTLSFTIPPQLGDNFFGLAFWIVYECKYAKRWSSGWLDPVITLKTKHTKRSYELSAVLMELGEEVQSKVEFTRDDIMIKSGDRIEVSFQIPPHKGFAARIKMKMWGAHIIHKAHSPPL